jgi:hypothetical protein
MGDRDADSRECVSSQYYNRRIRNLIAKLPILYPESNNAVALRAVDSTGLSSHSLPIICHELLTVLVSAREDRGNEAEN